MLYLFPARDWQSGIRHRWWCFEIRATRFAKWRRKFCSQSKFLLYSKTFTGFAVINKETVLIDELEGDANDLFEAAGL